MLDPHDNPQAKAALELHAELCRIARDVRGLAAGDYARHANTPQAVAYAEAAVHLAMQYDPKELPRAVQSQALYISCNIGTWRGQKATWLRNDLKALVDKASKL